VFIGVCGHRSCQSWKTGCILSLTSTNWVMHHQVLDLGWSDLSYSFFVIYSGFWSVIPCYMTQVIPLSQWVRLWFLSTSKLLFSAIGFTNSLPIFYISFMFYI
jgi:hypothetical protein